MMAKLKKFLTWLCDIFDDILAYILTVVGILCSNILPLMQSNEAFNLDISIWRIVGAMVISILLVSKHEQLPTDNKNSAKAREGRKKNFGYRMSYALSQGVMWSMFVNAGVK